MTAKEAIEAIEKGEKVTHEYFDKHEWVTKSPNPNYYLFEDNVHMHKLEFWQYRNHDGWKNGWSIFNTKTT